MLILRFDMKRIFVYFRRDITIRETALEFVPGDSHVFIPEFCAETA